MELWYYLFDVKYFDGMKGEDRGLICAPNKKTVLEKLEDCFGSDSIYDIRIYDVQMDTGEILFEDYFPGIIKMMENPKED